MDWVGLLKETWREYNEDNVPRLGAALAYYTFFAFFPLILLLIALIGYALAAGWPAARDAQEYVLDVVQRTIPAIGPEVRERLAAIVEARGALGLVGGATLLWSASNIFAQLDEAFDIIFDVEARRQRAGFLANLKTMIWDKATSMAMVLGIAFLLLVSLIISAALNVLAEYTETLPGSALFWQAGNVLLSLAITAGLFAAMFAVLPGRRALTRAVLVGGGVTAVAWKVGEQALAWYLGRSNYTAVYGLIGGVMALLIWIYYASQILFLGGELTAVYNHYLLRGAALRVPAEGAGASQQRAVASPAPDSFFVGVLVGAAITAGGLAAGVRQLARRFGR